MSMNNANISISADNRSSIEQTQKLTKSVQDLNKSVSETGNTISSVKTSWSLYVAAFNQYAQAIKTIYSGLKSAMDFGKEISAFDSVRNAFEKYTNSVGSKSDELLRKLRTVSGGVIDDMRLMQSLSNAMAKGITTDTEKLSDLMRVASQKAKIYGKEGGQVFNELVNAINKGSKEALQEVGINLPEGFEKLSKGMTKAEKQSRLLEIAISEGKKEIDKMGGELEDSSDSFARFDTAMKNLKTTSGTILLPALTSVAEMLAKILNETEDIILGFQEIFKDKPDINYNLTTSKSLKGLEKITIKKIEDYQKDLNSLKYIASGGGAGMPNSYAIANGGGSNNETYQNRVKRNEQILILESKIKDEQNKLLEIQKNLDYALIREQEAREKIETTIEETNNSASIASDTVIESINSVNKASSKTNDESDKLFKKFANLSDSLLPDIIKSEKDAFNILVKFSMQAGGLTSNFDKAAASAKKLEQELENSKAQKDIFNMSNGMSALGRAAGFTNIGLGMMTGNILKGDVISSNDFKDDFKKGYFSIRQHLEEDLAGAVTSGIVNSNLGDVLQSMVSSIAMGKANSYGSTLLGGLFSGSGFAGLGGAVTGFVGSIAVSAIANNWEKWFGDHGKEETKKSNAETKERGSNAILQTYAAMLNPYMTDDMLNNLYDSRYAAAGNLVVSYKSKRAGGIRGLVGGKNYTDTTPQKTFDLIAAMENAVDVIKDYNDKKEKELDLLSAQGYNYQVLSEQMSALSDTMDRVRYMNDTYSDSWSSGEKFSIDLSDNIQDLKKAYYEALREYGSETAGRKTRADTNFLNLFPYLDDTIYGGTVQYVAGYQTKNRLFGGKRTTPIYGYRDFDAYISDPYSAYSYIENASNQLDDRNATRQMFELIKMAGSNQYELAALQYTDSAEYEKQYIEMLERSRTAAELVMKEQEQIYLDATQTFEQQSAALQMYQDAQNQYYNAKLEMLSAEQAKEEQIRKEEAAANLRRQEQMEALLGFTGEIARTGNNVYILEGADQVGALKEMIQQYGDNPEALAALQAMLSAAQSKAKFGKIA